MTMRNTRRAALIGCLLAGLPAWAGAQEAPLALFPDAAGPSAAAPQKVETAPMGISIGGLSDVDVEAVGILSSSADEPWDRDLGSSVWLGVNRLAAQDGFRALPAAAASPAARGMARQLLLTAAAPLMVPGAPSAPGSLTALRLEALLASGLAEDAAALAAAVPRSAWSEAVLLSAARAGWLALDAKTACAQVDDGLQRFDAPVWSQMNAVCKAVSGDADKARLTVSLLDETRAVDDAFRPIADRIQGKSKLSLAQLPEGSGPFEAAALNLLGTKLPEDLPLAVKPWLARLAVPAEGPVGDGQIAILEQGLRRGVVPAAQAAQAMERVKFGKADLDAAKALKADAAGPRGRALYWQVLKATASAPAKAEIVARMFAAARGDRAAQAVLAVLLAKPLAALSADPAAAWLAGDAARAALLTGDWTAARRWADLALRNAGASDEARRVAASLRPLIHLIDAPAAAQARAAQSAPPMPEGLAASARDRLFGLYRVFSLAVADADWAAAVAAPAPAVEGMSPSPLLLAAVDDAAARGTVGLTLSLAAQALAEAGDKPLAAAASERLAAALLKVGAPDWAKRVAVESLLAAGY
jgi:hypothetical protein